jgi:hypothetical protein
MGSIDEIKNNLKDLWGSVEEFIKKRGAILAIIGSLAGLGSWQISDLWKHIHNIERLPEKFDQLDSLVVVVHAMDEVVARDTAAYDRYFNRMKTFLDTLPHLILEARDTKAAFLSVQGAIERLDSVQGEQDKKIYHFEKVIDGDRRSTRASF